MSQDSWEQINKNTVIKNLDYSSFEHKTTVVPIPFYRFFNLDQNSTDKVYLNLITPDFVFPVYVRHAYKSRSTPSKLLCWNKEFNEYLQNKYPQWNTISTFTKTDAFKLTFNKTENENEFRIDTNEELYLRNFVFNKFLDKIDENLSPKKLSISTTPVDYSDNDIAIASKEATVRTRKELKIQNRFIDVLKAKGYEAFSSQVDIIAKKSSEILFIEAKILTSETKAAQALGQLLFYQHSVKATEKATKLILLFDRKPQNETIEFIKKYKIDEIVYESKKDFKTLRLR